MVKFAGFVEQQQNSVFEDLSKHLCHFATVEHHFGKLFKWKMGWEVLNIN